MVRDWLLQKAPQYVEELSEDQKHEIEKWVTADPNEGEDDAEAGAEEKGAELEETANPLKVDSPSGVAAPGATFESEDGSSDNL
jgi:hypothetical protein